MGALPRCTLIAASHRKENYMDFLCRQPDIFLKLYFSVFDFGFVSSAIGLKAGNFLQRSKRLPPKCVHVQHIWFVLVPWIGLLGFLVLFTTCISYVVNVDFYDFLQKFEEPCSCAYVTFPRHCQPVINPKSSLSLHQVRHRQNLETCISGRFSRQDLQKQI